MLRAKFRNTPVLSYLFLEHIWVTRTLGVLNSFELLAFFVLLYNAKHEKQVFIKDFLRAFFLSFGFVIQKLSG